MSSFMARTCLGVSLRLAFFEDLEVGTLRFTLGRLDKSVVRYLP